MKFIIFAGGVGSRLWPLSRENAPKQFYRIFSGKSTLELAVGRIREPFGIENVYIQTIEKYRARVKEYIPDLPEENIIIEPDRRNLGPAVCLSVIELEKKGYTGPMALLWADHLMNNPEEFVGVLKEGKALVEEKPDRIIFLGEKPRFPNNNLGWIKTGERVGISGNYDYYSFEGWKYKPEVKLCNEMFKSGKCYWNPGYFVTSVKFLSDRYKELAPDIYNNVLNGKYSEAESISFDKAVIEKLKLKDAVVIKTNMGWSDPGTLYALKEALEENQQINVTHGEVTTIDTTDSLLYNFEEKKIVTAVGLHGYIVVNTKDALIVVPKEEVVKVTDLLKKIKDEGKTQYL